MSKVKCGLIQMGLKGDGTMSPEKIRDLMIEAHIPMIEDAAKQGVKVLCFQEVFTQPYFCPSQDKKWYAAAESIPDGPTVKLMKEYAKNTRWSLWCLSMKKKCLEFITILQQSLTQMEVI